MEARNSRKRKRNDDTIHYPNLPLEMQLHILSFLNYRDLAVIALVSKEFHSLSIQDYLWKRQLNLFFNENKPNENETYRQMFFWRAKKEWSAFLIFHAFNQSSYDPITYLNNNLPSNLGKSKGYTYASLEEIERECESHSSGSPFYVLEFALGVRMLIV